VVFPKDIVKQLIEAEKIPITQLERRKEKIESKKNLTQELTKLVEEVRGGLRKNLSERDFKELKVDTNDELIAVTLDKNLAYPATYQFQVDKLAQKSSALTNGVPDKEETYLGVGYIQYKLPNGEEKEIYIDSENSSLSKIASLINKDEDIGMRATIIHDGTDSKEPYRLIMSLKETGDVNKAEFPYLYFVDGEYDLYLEKERPAHDAIVLLDGFPIEVQENQVKDVIPGAVIDLKKARPGEEFTLTIGEDTEAINLKFKDMVENINSVLKFIKEQNTLNESSDTSRTLGGDSLLQSVESRIRSSIFSYHPTQSGNKRIGDFGIAFTRDGILEFDEQKFVNELKKDSKTASQFFIGYKDEKTNSRGFNYKLYTDLNELLTVPSGVLFNRKRGFENRISDLDRQKADKERMIAKKEENLKQKFARLETTINQIKSQGAGLAAISGSMGNPITQL